MHQFTQSDATVYTDAWRGYNALDRCHAVVCHRDGEWARDADADGICEVHTNSIESVWTTVRNFLRPFRGVHKKFLAGYIAICEFAINLKTITLCLFQNLFKHRYAFILDISENSKIEGNNVRQMITDKQTYLTPSYM